MRKNAQKCAKMRKTRRDASVRRERQQHRQLRRARVLELIHLRE